MSSRDIGVAMMQLGAHTMRALMLADPPLVRRNGFRVVRRGGLVCYSSTRLPKQGVFNHVSGYGTFAAASQHAIEAVLRHYASLGARGVRVEVLVPTVTPADRALLRRNGFRETEKAFDCQIRSTLRPPVARAVAQLEVRRVGPDRVRQYVKLASAGFGDTGAIALVFERGWTRQLRRDPRVVAFMGSVDGTPAATGVIHRGTGISGLYSGSVLKRYRGRGIQNAMIAARLRYGWSLGDRVFYSWTSHAPASAANLRDEGFVTRYAVHLYERAV